MASEPGALNLSLPGLGLPVATRMAHEIPKPKNHQDLQRKCRVLYRHELNDPNCREHGRNGQDQSGIDIIGKRDGDASRPVAVQCRLITVPIRYEKILEDCHAALTLPDGLKPREIIFATTAPNDVDADKAAARVEQELRALGHDVSVVVLGWEELQNRISLYEQAYEVFNPAAAAAAQAYANIGTVQQGSLGLQVSELSRLLQTAIHQGSSPLNVRDTEAASLAGEAEDPALHARIDLLRDLFQADGWKTAERELRKLCLSADLERKPWARYRVTTFLAHIALQRGHVEDAVSGYEIAYGLQPDQTRALANLSLARLHQGRFAEAQELARAALGKGHEPSAVGNLIQAAARSAWEGDPLSLIPAGYERDIHIDSSLAEFYRVRELEGWEALSRDIARKYPDALDLAPIEAVAVLSALFKNSGYVAGAPAAVDYDDILHAADRMARFARRMLEQGFPDEWDRDAHLNNACVLMRVLGRHQDVLDLLQQAKSAVDGASHLRRLRAIALIGTGRWQEAVDSLTGDTDPENQILRADVTGSRDPKVGLALAEAVEAAGLPDHLAKLRFRTIAELALMSRNEAHLERAVLEMERTTLQDPETCVWRATLDHLRTGDGEALKAALRAAARLVTDATPPIARVSLAGRLRDGGLPLEASELLDGRIDLARQSPAAVLYLQSLAEARRDEKFRAAFAGAADALRNMPDLLWTSAAHAWNSGDLPTARAHVERLVANEPANLRFQLFRLQVVERQGQGDEVNALLALPLEDLPGSSLNDKQVLIGFLSRKGFEDRASRLAYRLFSEHQDEPEAWSSLAHLVFQRRSGGPSTWDVSAVANDVAVDSLYEDGERLFFIVEPDASLRNLSGDAWPPDHPLVRAVTGFRKGADFTDSDGRPGTVVDLRHKLVARFHKVCREYERRFPEHFAFRSLNVDPSRLEGLEELKVQLATLQARGLSQAKLYEAGNLPFGLLPFALGTDELGAADALAASGISLNVTIGTIAEREAGVRLARLSTGEGCVLDVLSFWTAWTAGVIDVVSRQCGQVHLSQRTVDVLRLRRNDASAAMSDGKTVASYQDGKVVFNAFGEASLEARFRSLARALEWIEGHAVVSPVLLDEASSPALRELLRTVPAGVFDAFVIARSANLLLITDDIFIRHLALSVEHRKACWLHAVLLAARERGRIAPEQFVRAVACLVLSGQFYIGVTSLDLLQAAALPDGFDEGSGPFVVLSTLLGGKTAEIVSHVTAASDFLRLAWRISRPWDRLPDLGARRPLATSILLKNLLRSRHDDHVEVMRVLIASAAWSPELQRFLRSWAQGHFIAVSPPSLEAEGKRDARSPALAASGRQQRAGLGKRRRAARQP